MKRSPIARKTPLKRGTKGLKKSRLRKASPEKQSWTKLYTARKKQDGQYVRCAASGLLMHVSLCHPHHPFTRWKDGLMAYLWISKSFHDHLHKFGTQSYAIGWLHPQHYGRRADPSWPRPWGEIHEANWPERFRRLAS